MNRNYLFFLSIIFFLQLVGCKNSQENYAATGVFEAREVLVSSEANGRLLWWNGREGQKVEKDQLLGGVDSTQLYLEKLSLLAQGRSVRAASPDIRKQIAPLARQLEQLRSERVRIQRLVDAAAANQKQLDDIDAQIGVITTKMAAIESGLVKSNAQLYEQSSAIDIQVAKVNYMLEKTNLRSPLQGVILQSFVEPGELVGVGIPLCKVARLDTLYLRVYASYAAVTHLKLGDTVPVYVDRGRQDMAHYTGRVTWISQEAEFTPKMVQTKSERENLSYAVKIYVPNDGMIKIGMYGEMRLSY